MLKIKFISKDNIEILNKDIEDSKYNLQFLYQENPTTKIKELQGNLKINDIECVNDEINNVLLNIIDSNIKQINIEKIDQNSNDVILKIPFDILKDPFIDTVGLKINFQQKIIINENNINIFKSAF